VTALDEKPRSRALTRDEFQRFSPMVRRQAMWLARRGPRRLMMSDLIAAGFSGLIDALTTAEETSDADFEVYANHRVKGAMLQHIEALDPMLSETRSLSRSIARGIAAVTTTLGRSPTSDEIADALSMTEDEYCSSLLSIWHSGLARVEVIDLDRSVQQQLSEESETPKRSLAEAIELLPEPSQEILMLLYQENCSFEEAAAVLGTTIRKVEIAASETMHRVRAITGRE